MAFNKEDVFRGIFVDEIGRSEKEYKFLSTIDTQEYIDITIIETIAENFISELDKLKQKLEEAYKLRQDDILTESLYESIITYIQGDVIANLNVFMDESYLKYLLHVLNDNNPDNLKLRPIKSNIRLDDISMNYEKGCNISWMVIQQIVTNCWQDYKFLNFKEKFLNITKPVDYVCNLNTKEEIFKHVLIRNCYQHHEGELTDDALKLIGKDKIYIRSNNDSKLEIKKWAIIKLTYEEVEHLIDAMSEFASDYNQHIARRMKVREKKKDTSRHMRELINYIYYLQYEENVDDIVVKTREAYFTVFESSTFKVNYEESSAEELYQLIDECGGEAECNGVIFKKIGDKYEAEYNIPTLVRNEQPNIIQL